MKIVATNIRFPEDQYQKYRIIALKQRKSFAELVRQSLERANWQFEDTKVENRRREAASRLLKTKKIKLDKPIREMIEEGRKY